MRKRYMVGLATGLMVFGLASGAGATLTTVGTATYSGTAYNLIYDNDLQITWLDYTNIYSKWQNQVNWAAGLNTTGVLTYNLNSGFTASWTGDWRLPSAGVNPQIGYNQTTSEMGHLYYTELRNTAGVILTNKGDFRNLEPSWYWSGTELASYSYIAWTFNTFSGLQDWYGEGYYFYALAVRPGQVSAGAPVPEPATMLLMGSGLVGLVGLRRRKRVR